MESVKRYRFKGAAGEYVYAADFDRVSAENLALQQRLTVQDQREDDFKLLLRSAETVIGQFMPNVGKCFGIDFMLLNETLCAIGAALKPTTEAKP